jgi:hypothetical protein
LSIKVFISHSTKSRDGAESGLDAVAHRQFVESFCSFLERRNCGIIPFIDKNIPLGATWRDVIFSELDGCHAAVVFVNRQALEDSDWVNAEVIVLGYRKYLEKDGFNLILIPFGGVNSAEIAKNPKWEPVSIGELQIYPQGGLSVGEKDEVERVFNEIFQILEKIPDNDDFTPSAWIVSRLCYHLPLEMEALKKIAAKLNLANLPSSLGSARRQLAKELYSIGSMVIKDLVCVSAMPKDTDFQELLDLVATYWVDIVSSFPILSYCSVRKGNVFVMNGKEWEHTPKTFIRQICGMVYPWVVIPVEIQGADPVLEIYSEVVKLTAYRRVLNYQSESMNDNNVDKINALMERSTAAPVFVTFLAEKGCGVADVIKGIQSVFPSINIIVCTGTEPGSPLSLSDGMFITLTEGINLEDEREEFFKYCDALTNLSK